MLKDGIMDAFPGLTSFFASFDVVIDLLPVITSFLQFLPPEVAVIFANLRQNALDFIEEEQRRLGSTKTR